MTMQSLNHLQTGQIGLVQEIHAKGSIRRRLQDIGVIKGTQITCLQKSFFGDPIAYLIRGAVIALRKEDSQDIQIKPFNS